MEQRFFGLISVTAPAAANRVFVTLCANSLIKNHENISPTLTFAAAGLTRPAPAETPQGRNTARIGGCSGAM
jgi:hypothetical protein